MAAHIATQEKTREINPDALNALLARAVQDMGAAMQAPLTNRRLTCGQVRPTNYLVRRRTIANHLGA